MPRFPIVLPVVTPRVMKLHPAEDCDAMVHFLAIELVMDVAARMKQVCREDIILRLGFLEAQDVRLFLVEKTFDDGHAGADRINVPGGDFKLGHGKFCSALLGGVKEGLLAAVPHTGTKRPLLRGHGARADQALSRKAIDA